MPKLDVNGLQIEYDSFGDAGADPVLLIMGLATQMTAWTPEFCKALAARGHYVIRFDNRDIGLSTKFDGVRAPGRLRFLMNHLLRVPLRAPYSLRDMAADAIGVLDALEINAAHVVGASMGGMIAQLAAIEYPQRVKTLTSIMSTSGARHLPRTRPEVVKHVWMNRPKTGGKDAALEHTVMALKMIGSPGYPRSDDNWRALVNGFLDRSFYPQAFERHLAAVISDGSRVERLKALDRPTLVIHGREDPMVPVECGIDTAKHIEGARLEIIDGMGHDLPPQLYETLTGLISGHAQAHA